MAPAPFRQISKEAVSEERLTASATDHPGKKSHKVENRARVSALAIRGNIDRK
jgi:hypothetical protein